MLYFQSPRYTLDFGEEERHDASDCVSSALLISCTTKNHESPFMLKMVALAFGVLCLSIGLHWRYHHPQWLADQEASYTIHTGRIAESPDFKFKTDASTSANGTTA